MALTKLEKRPKQVSLDSVLNSRNRTRFLREAGISYNALTTKKFKADSHMDVSTFSIDSWISGQSHFAPSWRNLLGVMKNISESDKDKDNINCKEKDRLKKVAEDIEGYLKEMEVRPSTSNIIPQISHKSKDNLDGKSLKQL